MMMLGLHVQKSCPRKCSMLLSPCSLRGRTPATPRVGGEPGGSCDIRQKGLSAEKHATHMIHIYTYKYKKNKYIYEYVYVCT